jgi:DNA-binding MarR family transcriptional regulator
VSFTPAAVPEPDPDVRGASSAADPVAAAVSDPVAELGVALERMASWLRRVTPPLEWNAVALTTLDRLARDGSQRICDLVSQARITQPGMTGLVTRLAAAGLVTRSADPTDGRAALVSITADGRDYIRHVHDLRAQTLARHIGQLSEKHRLLLVSAIEALDNLAAEPIDRPATG